MSEDVAKGFQFKYENFLWIEVHEIRKMERQGNPALALEYTLSLVKYLADEIKKETRDKADKIGKAFRSIRGEGPSFFVQGVDQHRARQRYAKMVLPGLIDELTSMLDRRGYMEKKGVKPRAKGHGKLRIQQ